MDRNATHAAGAGTRRRLPARSTAIVITASLLAALAGCGTRVSHQAVQADSAPSTVSLDPASIAALHNAGSGTSAAGQPRAGTSLPSKEIAGIGPAGQPSAGPQPVSAHPQRPSPLDRSKTPATRPVGPSIAANATAEAAPPAVLNAASDTRCAKSLDAVPVGQVGTFSGVAGPVTDPARKALAVWAKDINTRGGLACHPVAVYSEDDGGDPSRAAYLVHDLAANRHVIALVANLVPLSSGGFFPALDAAKIPAIGGGSYTTQDFEDRWYFPEGASAKDQVIGIIRDGVELGHRRLGALYCVEATSCAQSDQYFKDGAAAAGAQVAYNSPASVGQPDYTAQCLNARDAKVDLLGLALDGASIGRVARSCAAIGYHPVIATSAALFGPGQANDPTIRSFGVATTTPEAPWFLDDQPGLRAFHQALARFAPDIQPTGGSLLAWASGELLRAAVDKVSYQAQSGPITADLVMKGLGQIKNETLGGLTGPLSFTPDEAHANSNGCVFYELLSPAGWSAPKGSQRECARP
jgi:branched-chain amino acid transport system substrate-binding protein